MGLRPGLATWQWQTYPRNHTQPLNLAVHLFAVPAFEVAILGALTYLAAGAWLSVVFSIAAAGVAFALQGIGHKNEPEPPIPFDGGLDAVSRIFVEQFFTFPRFVFTGGWSRAWAEARRTT